MNNTHFTNKNSLREEKYQTIWEKTLSELDEKYTQKESNNKLIEIICDESGFPIGMSSKSEDRKSKNCF